ncbi:MAG: hypothetical protein AUG49_10005 [Catenulispora sp. 13_1_20CM_3_70_7]|jgi:hypothetical protein|nr:MAG: hypothetical protein AUG49_10005 [Catenulispora sp. 13_1_20CM_3_70_7]
MALGPAKSKGGRIVSDPNSWTPVKVTNNTGGEITSLLVKHRYDTDHYDEKKWSYIQDGTVVDGLTAGYWTGPFRTGKDYWYVEFEVDGKKYSCKDTFYCFLTSADADSHNPVMLTVSKGDMTVNPPRSSGCQVKINQP